MADAPIRLITLTETCRRLRESKAKFFRRRSCPGSDFPRPVETGGNRLFFVEAEVEEWLRQRLASRGDVAA